VELEEGMEAMLAGRKGGRLNADLPSGEGVILIRKANGIQILYPDRPRREPMLLPDKRQQDEPGVS